MPPCGRKDSNMARKTVSAELKERIKSVLSNVPISLNAHFGDPCQPNQWENTLEKIRYLKAQGYQGEIEISTKWILTDAQLDELQKIAPDLWIICGVTGLNEMKGVSMEERFDHYLRVCKRFPKTIINVRPLIPGKNDSMAVLAPIVEVAAKGRRLLKHGGYVNPTSMDNSKTKYEDLKREIHAYCEKLGVNDGPKCTCLVTDVTGRVCTTFAELEPTNLDVLEALGFDFVMEDGYVKLTGFEGSGQVTKGDVSFARFIIQSSRIRSEWTDPHAYMQMKNPDGQTMICTSSWFHWAKEVPCMVNCFYCHVRPENPFINATQAGDTGCSPIDLYEYLFED